MVRPYVSAFTIVLTSLIFSEAFACDPDPLKKHFSSLKKEESSSMHQYCGVLYHNPGDFETVKKLKELFGKKYEQDTVALGTISGCAVRQLIEAAC